MLVSAILTIIITPNINALGQSSSSSNSTTVTQQTWIDKLNNLKIHFGYSPKEPVIDKPTELSILRAGTNAATHKNNGPKI